MKGSHFRRKIAQVDPIDLKGITDFIQQYEAAAQAYQQAVALYKETADEVPGMMAKVDRMMQQSGDPATKKYLTDLSNRLGGPKVQQPAT